MRLKVAPLQRHTTATPPLPSASIEKVNICKKNLMKSSLCMGSQRGCTNSKKGCTIHTRIRSLEIVSTFWQQALLLGKQKRYYDRVLSRANLTQQSLLCKIWNRGRELRIVIAFWYPFGLPSAAPHPAKFPQKSSPGKTHPGKLLLAQDAKMLRNGDWLKVGGSILSLWNASIL